MKTYSVLNLTTLLLILIPSLHLKTSWIWWMEINLINLSNIWIQITLLSLHPKTCSHFSESKRDIIQKLDLLRSSCCRDKILIICLSKLTQMWTLLNFKDLLLLIMWVRTMKVMNRRLRMGLPAAKGVATKRHELATKNTGICLRQNSSHGFHGSTRIFMPLNHTYVH